MDSYSWQLDKKTSSLPHKKQCNEKTTSLLRTIGFQSPIELNDSGFVGSVSYSGMHVIISCIIRNVKLEGSHFLRLYLIESFYFNRDDSPLDDRTLLIG